MLTDQVADFLAQMADIDRETVKMLRDLGQRTTEKIKKPGLDFYSRKWKTVVQQIQGKIDRWLLPFD